MSAARKIVCLGGGSNYFIHVIPELLIQQDLGGSEIVLYDIDLERAELMAAMTRRLAEQAGTGFSARATCHLADAVDGAHFAISSIGGGGAGALQGVVRSYYHAADVRIPAKYGIHQVLGDTCGPAAMMMAFRSLPIYMGICREMEKRCPDAILISHSNPMAVLCRAMRKHTGIRVIGLCHGVQGGRNHAAGILELPAHELECVWIGTNHYYWLTRIRHNGRDVYPELLERGRSREPVHGTEMTSRLSQLYGYQIVYPQDDHIIEFYPFVTQISGQDELPYGLIEKVHHYGYDASEPMPEKVAPTAEQRRAFLQGFSEQLDERVLPQTQSNPALSESVGALISAITHGRREVFIVNVANEWAIPNLPPTAEVELEGVTDSLGVRPIHVGDAPLLLKGMLEKRFVWHEYVADAAVLGDRKLALQALMIDEMAIVPEKAEAMLDELLAASADMLPQFG